MKKIIVLALVLVLALSLLTACGGKDNGGGSATPPASNNTPDNGGGNANADDKWPDNEYTQQLPKPTFTISSSSAYSGGGYIFTCKEATFDECKAYVETLKSSGFTIDEGGGVLGSEISWNAKNADGYKVLVNAFDGNYDYPTIQITKP
ncbi:MAG: hypothetical protein LBN02_04295 [Oscillospiraceae bacterium]|nr:hypothetical protein [Oscillospiraceae bacterium]